MKTSVSREADTQYHYGVHYQGDKHSKYQFVARADASAAAGVDFQVARIEF